MLCVAMQFSATFRMRFLGAYSFRPEILQQAHSAALQHVRHDLRLVVEVTTVEGLGIRHAVIPPDVDVRIADHLATRAPPERVSIVIPRLSIHLHTFTRIQNGIQMGDVMIRNTILIAFIRTYLLSFPLRQQTRYRG